MLKSEPVSVHFRLVSVVSLYILIVSVVSLVLPDSPEDL